MKIGDSVEISTRQFKGAATISYISPTDIFPVQVELKVPDSDGHCVYRVAFHEILDDKKSKVDESLSTTIPVQNVEKLATENQRVMPATSTRDDERQMSFFDFVND